MPTVEKSVAPTRKPYLQAIGKSTSAFTNIWPDFNMLGPVMKCTYLVYSARDSSGVILLDTAGSYMFRMDTFNNFGLVVRTERYVAENILESLAEYFYDSTTLVKSVEYNGSLTAVNNKVYTSEKDGIAQTLIYDQRGELEYVRHIKRDFGQLVISKIINGQRVEFTTIDSLSEFSFNQSEFVVGQGPGKSWNITVNSHGDITDMVVKNFGSEAINTYTYRLQYDSWWNWISAVYAVNHKVQHVETRSITYK